MIKVSRHRNKQTNKRNRRKQGKKANIGSKGERPSELSSGSYIYNKAEFF